MGPRQYYPVLQDSDVTRSGHDGGVVRAVVFDFYGTLAHWADLEANDYTTVFARHGYQLDREVMVSYFSRYDGVAHEEHSVDEAAYEAWVRLRLRELAMACRVDAAHVEPVVDALRALDQGEMVAYPEARQTLDALRNAGVAVAVCSNWGWELDAYLDQVGLLDLIDVAVTSARAGSRKPHPGIYAEVIGALAVDPRDVVFVGDSWEPDVRGPRRLGMTAVHIWREDERVGWDVPALEPGDHRVPDLWGVLEIAGLTATSPLAADR
jgi:putative hydrolase of the HAD superfamily